MDVKRPHSPKHLPVQYITRPTPKSVSVYRGDLPYRVRKSFRHTTKNRGAGDRLNNYARVAFNRQAR